MLYYNPLNGDPLTEITRVRSRTCFIMTKLGTAIPAEIPEIRESIEEVLGKYNYTSIDANSCITGRDILNKIWKLIVQVPIGICIVHEKMNERTYANLFYELGLMQAYGKETLVIRQGSATIPSDFVRTEYVSYDKYFQKHMCQYMDNLSKISEHYEEMADQLENNPLLSLDYLRRAYMLNGDERIRGRAREVLTELRVSGRAKNSVEMLHASFCQ